MIKLVDHFLLVAGSLTVLAQEQVRPSTVVAIKMAFPPTRPFHMPPTDTTRIRYKIDLPTILLGWFYNLLFARCRFLGFLWVVLLGDGGWCALVTGII